ncbi:MAG TPA: type I glyceraldehyde-3-phosphate dehydrogenase [Flavobacteriaceae bacterium]|nr:type I glyceraldehyde-3-phosphate dehydrogenase [Flavobacteriaceae bacterium]
MQVKKIGINGFGRIGRLAMRVILENPKLEVVGVNDLMDIEQLAYLLKHDSVHGALNKKVQIKGESLVVDGETIRVTAIKDAEKLDWKALGVDLVLDCTGVYRELESASKHLEAGAKKVLISAPSKTAPMYVMGVNHEKMTAQDTIISNASCTTNCLAPMAKIINDNFGLKEGLMTTIHAVTGSQAVVDQSNRKNYRMGRSALDNIIPTSTGAAVAVTKVIPELKGKLTGMAFRVPVANVSVVDLTVKTEKATSIQEINKVFEQASKEDYQGLVAYVDQPLVSQDFISNTYLCNYDAGASMELNPNFFKLVGWYDNEYGYAANMVDLAIHSLNL